MSADLPHSIGQSAFRIMGVEIVVHQLSTGERIIEADSMHALFDAMAREDRPEPGDLEALAKAVRGGVAAA